MVDDCGGTLVAFRAGYPSIKADSIKADSPSLARSQCTLGFNSVRSNMACYTEGFSCCTSRSRQKSIAELLAERRGAAEKEERERVAEENRDLRETQRQRQSGYRLPETQGALRVYGTAQENFEEAQKWRGIPELRRHFGEVPGGQRPNNNNALHYFNAALSIDPTHEFAISHRAYCLWTLGRQHEAIGVLSVGLAKNQFPNHADTVRGWPFVAG